MKNNDFLSTIIAGNTIWSYAISLGVFLFSLLVVYLVEKILISRFRRFAGKSNNKYDDLLLKLINCIGPLFYIAIALIISLQFLNIHDVLYKFLSIASWLVIAYYVVSLIEKIAIFLITQAFQFRNKEQEKVNLAVIGMIGIALKVLLWGVALILVLQNIGFNVSALLGGFGVAGIAIAFAMQNVLTDIFAYITINFDKPFEIGDYIVVGQDSGTVKRVGIKSTRIITLQGQELIVSNKELTESRIQNYKKMKRRRTLFTFGVTYETPVAKLRQIPLMVKAIITKHKTAEVDRIFFKEFGDFSLNFEVVYYLNTRDYQEFIKVQEKINLDLTAKFASQKIEFAYPTQTIILNK